MATNAASPTCQTATLPDQESTHARRVLRVRSGEQVELFDGRGRVARGQVMDVGKVVTVRIDSVRDVPRTLPTITIATAIPKGSRAEDMVNQLSQLGVDTFVPMLCDRSEGSIRDNKLQRFERIAIESAKQCGRAWLMEIGEPQPFSRMMEADADLRLFADAGRCDAIHWREGIARMASITALIGPEGGWTDNERAAASRGEFQSWSVSPNVLRIETAAVAAAALLREAVTVEPPL